MNVYDFDNTIYNGDSTIDFYKFCLKRRKSLLGVLPRFFGRAVKYLFGFCDKTYMKEAFYRFLPRVDDIDGAVKEFWDTHRHSIKPLFYLLHKSDDVIISASPTFLLSGICGEIGAKMLIASEVDKNTGASLGRNCDGEEKVRRLAEAVPGFSIDAFYSDSNNDLPLALLSKRAFKVRGGRVNVWRVKNE